MKYYNFDNEAEAIDFLADAVDKGLRGYYICYHGLSFQCRIWG